MGQTMEGPLISSPMATTLHDTPASRDIHQAPVSPSSGDSVHDLLAHIAQKEALQQTDNGALVALSYDLVTRLVSLMKQEARMNPNIERRVAPVLARGDALIIELTTETVVAVEAIIGADTMPPLQQLQVLICKAACQLFGAKLPPSIRLKAAI